MQSATICWKMPARHLLSCKLVPPSPILKVSTWWKVSSPILKRLIWWKVSSSLGMTLLKYCVLMFVVYEYRPLPSLPLLHCYHHYHYNPHHSGGINITIKPKWSHCVPKQDEFLQTAIDHHPPPLFYKRKNSSVLPRNNCPFHNHHLASPPGAAQRLVGRIRLGLGPTWLPWHRRLLGTQQQVPAL